MTMRSIEPQHSNEHWTRIAHHAPVLAVTCQDYVAQISVTMRPSTTEGVDIKKTLSDRPPAYQDWTEEQKKIYKDICGKAMQLAGYEIEF